MPLRVQYLRGLGGGETSTGLPVAIGHVDAQTFEAGGGRFHARIVDADMASEGRHSGRRIEAFESQSEAIGNTVLIERRKRICCGLKMPRSHIFESRHAHQSVAVGFIHDAAPPQFNVKIEPFSTEAKATQAA